MLAWQLAKAMHERKIIKAALARRMRTSRSALDRLLDPRNASVTLATMGRGVRQATFDRPHGCAAIGARPYITTPPGAILLSAYIKPRASNANRLAAERQVPASRINAIFRGTRGVTADTAMSLVHCQTS